MEAKLYVGNLPYNTVDADLWQQLTRPCPFADLLGRAEGTAAASGLIAAGAIIAISGDVA